MSRLSKFLGNILTSMGQLLNLISLPRWLRKSLYICALAGTLVYLSIFITIGSYAKQLIKTPPTQSADAALILGNRAYLYGKPNPCLTGRVDEGLLLAQQGLVSTLLMSGGLDYEDNRIEALTMETHARNKGFQGRTLLESRSSSTLENLTFSLPILEATGIKNIIIVSEPYHMWRVKKLVEAGHLGRKINVGYAAAPSQCWISWGMAFKGALREPLAVINNYAKGYF
ncbi:YdcF family protein [Methylotenera sp.]|uniref:YdcF family protein n=1 Tax=Methylotenera sp. TaxID=2051956 RepID=UPI002488D61E|nr:YdcF family protein [Methylotenera sp.]MDI1299556.1 YdcF family protein [Methylotenera sp.]